MNLKVDGKTIQIDSSNNSSSQQANAEVKTVAGKYQGWPIYNLEERKTELERFVTDTESDKGNMVKSLEISSKKTESTSDKFAEIREKNVEETKKNIQEAETNIAKYTSSILILETLD